MNRVLVYLNASSESSIDRKRNRLKEALAHIGELTGGIVDVFVTPDCIPTFHIASDLDSDACGKEIPGMEHADSFIASELRVFASRCLDAAAVLEGGDA